MRVYGGIRHHVLSIASFGAYLSTYEIPRNIDRSLDLQFTCRKEICISRRMSFALAVADCLTLWTKLFASLMSPGL